MVREKQGAKVTPGDSREGWSPLQPVNPAASGVSSECLPPAPRSSPVWKTMGPVGLESQGLGSNPDSITWTQQVT